GGQRQRLAIWMSLINDPELLLLDEPTAGLDPAGRRELHRLIRSLASKRRAILMTTHYLEEAEAICDRVVVLRRGRIVADGTPLELLRHAAGASTVWLRVDGALDPGALITAGTVQMEPEGGYLRFQTTDPAAFVSTLGDVLRKQTLSLTDLRLKRPTLEDVYLELVAETASEGVSPR
ncbi:MAG: ABC transporter ATP-binding protein, partial [Candidatus Eisenbacteria bacterium]|nr:ABC transporter ATP-binding protein [Candidatus Eisenbacteria bacterium]